MGEHGGPACCRATISTIPRWEPRPQPLKGVGITSLHAVRTPPKAGTISYCQLILGYFLERSTESATTLVDRAFEGGELARNKLYLELNGLVQDT